MRSYLQTLLFLIPLFIAAIASAQTTPEDLTRSITAQDAALFDAYNTCNLDKFASFFTDDVEFYHDQTGLSVGKQKLTQAIKENICGKVTRELVPGTLEIYPMKGYGAVEIGVHRFHHPGDPAKDDVGEASFIHLWQNKDGAWKITRVISYDHHGAQK
jgi:ketosteroid isomerase-like protein